MEARGVHEAGVISELREFLAMLAHALRNPLAPIVNALAVLNRVVTLEPLDSPPARNRPAHSTR